jgi:hypothetical protein
MAGVLYVGAAALRLDPGSKGAWAALLVGPLLLVLGFRLAAPPARGVDRIEPAARGATRAVVGAAVFALAAWLAGDGASFVAARRFGVGVACVASLVALTHVSSLGGVAARKPRPRYDAVVVSALLWLVAVSLAVARAVVSGDRPILAPAVIDLAAVTASLGTLIIALVAASRLYVQRRFELGVAERAAAASWLTVLSLCVGVFAALMAVAPPESVVPWATLTAAVLITIAAVAREPTRISRLLRTSASVTLLCAPLVSIAVVVAYKAPTHAGLILFVVTIAAAGLGLLAPRLAHRLAPERGLWLRVLADALVAAKQPDPRQAVIAVLVAIRDGLGLVGLSEEEGIAPRANQPALYRLASSDRVTVDRAGYMHVDEVEIPHALIDIAAREPERVLSTESLRHVQVTRPEVRELVAWLDARGAGMVALVQDEDVCVGMLLWPAAGRESPLSHEEVVDARRLAEHLGAVTGAAAQLRRSRARELEAEHAVANAEQRLGELRAVIERQALRQRALAEMFARPAHAASYSPAAQSVLVEVERLGQRGQPFALLAPPGVDPLCWAAVAHLASDRRDGTLLVVDAAISSEQALERWSDAATSPIEVARDGTLVVLDAQALSEEAQRYIGSAMTDGMGLVLALADGPRAMHLEAHLEALLEGRKVALPSLAERAEDLRALALHKLSRIGTRLRGKAFGISLQAQALLNEHDWPGNDAELDAVLLRAALATSGDVVDAAALLQVIGRVESLSESGPQRAAH